MKDITIGEPVEDLPDRRTRNQERWEKVKAACRENPGKFIPVQGLSKAYASSIASNINHGKSPHFDETFKARQSDGVLYVRKV